MEDNGTVNQLKNALNQLLNAYESLKDESEQLKKENLKLKEDVQSLEVMNTGLNTRLTSLTDTKEHHSSEMDEMLGKIESILGESEIESKVEEEVEAIVEDEEVLALEEVKKEDDFNNNTKDIDLGRMQSLLNGFNN